MVYFFKDDSEDVVSYSLGEVIRYVFHVWGCIRILVLDGDALILPLVRNLYIPLPFGLGCCCGWRL